MAMKIYVANVGEEFRLNLEDGSIIKAEKGMGEVERGVQRDMGNAIAVQLKELFESVMKEIKPSITQASDLTVEIHGSIDAKFEGGVNYLIFNVGATGTASGTMKVTLNTKLAP